jgi:hypothetical protein
MSRRVTSVIPSRVGLGVGVVAFVVGLLLPAEASKASLVLMVIGVAGVVGGARGLLLGRDHREPR